MSLKTGSFLRFRNFLLLLVMLGSPTLAGRPPDWPFPDLPFRVSLVAKSGIYPRDCALIHWQIDPQTSLATGMTSAVDVSSFRVVATGSGLAKEVPSVFQPVEPGEDGAGAGDLVWPMAGHVEPLARVPFTVYFDVVGPVPHPAPRYPLIPGAVTGRTNLVRNPGFEQVASASPTLPAEWALSKRYGGQGGIELVTEPTHSGRHAVKITKLLGVVGCQQQHVTLKPNTLYRFGFWARAAMGAGDESPHVRLLAPLYQANGKSVQTVRSSFEISGWPQPDRWMQIQKRGLFPYHSEVITPPDTAYCNPAVEVSDGGSGSVYVDDVAIFELAAEDLIPPVTVEVGALERAALGSTK